MTQAERQVSVGFSDGSTGDYDLVVGADGIASAVRQLTFSIAPPVYTGQMVWRSLAPIHPPGLSRVQFLLGEGCFFGLCSVGDGQTYGFGNLTTTPFRDAVHGRLERLRKRFAAFGEIVQEFLAALSSDEQIHCSPIEWVEQTAWQSGRVVLIGDTAHASSPMMGQGGCLAMEDAWVLAEVLREAERVERALELYVNRRSPRVAWVRQQSLAIAEAFGLPAAVRNATLRERGDQMMHARFGQIIPTP